MTAATTTTSTTATATTTTATPTTRRPLRRTLALGLGATLALSACEGGGDDGSASGRVGPGEDPAALTVERDVPADDLGDLPTFTGPWTKKIALAQGLLPPTNSWIAPAVFDPADRPVFTGVLSARLAADTVTLGLPQPTTDAKVVMAAHRDDLPLGLPADGYTVTRLGDVSATTTYAQAGEAVGELTLAEGWPYAAYRATTAQEVTVPDGLTADGAAHEVEVGGVTYRLLTDGTVDGTSLSLGEGQELFVYAVPEGAGEQDVVALDAGAVMLEDTAVEASVSGDQVGTTISYRTEGGAPTVVAAAPHRELDGSAELLDAAYPSVLGELRLVEGTELTSTTPVQPAVGELDLDGLDQDERAQVEAALEEDVAGLTFDAPDSYHGGKQVQRAANLYRLATQLERTDLADEVRTATVAQLDQWFDPEGCSDRAERCFRYDDHLRGLVGQSPSYGSDEFNDHHFHYGHFLYAAGVLAADDPALAERWATVADLVARDFGAPEESSHFPRHRVFDEWRGHSFASGTAPFADGNNQESSSEAVNAWTGLSLWAQARGDEELAEHASWLLSEETAATLAYWVDPELDEAFGQPVVSLNWQGKRDFATFFSDEPSAVVGIQLIPMGPTQVDYLGRVPDAVAAMAEAVGDLEPGRPLVDYDLMALSVVDPEAAAEALEDFDRDDLDPGTSMAYVTALVLSR